MKIYKRILAGILAANIFIGSVLTNTVDANAANATTKAKETTQQSVTSVLNDKATKTSDSRENAGTASVEPEQSTQSVGDLQNNVETVQSQTDDGDVSANEVEVENSADAEAQPDVDVQEAGTTFALNTMKLKYIKGYDADNKTVTIDSIEKFILLTHCSPEEQAGLEKIILNFTGGNISFIDPNTNAEIKIAQGDKITSFVNVSNFLEENNLAVDVSVEEITITAGQEFKYQKIGNRKYPFAGSLEGLNSVTLSICTTLFGGLSSKATSSKLSIAWVGDSSMPVLADDYVLEGNGSIPLSFSNVTGSLIGTVSSSTNSSSDTLTIAGSEISYAVPQDPTGGSDTVEIPVKISTDSDAGLICGKLESGSICLSGYSFPGQTTSGGKKTASAYTVTSKKGNAGGLIGTMGENTKLEIANAENATVSKIEVEAEIGDAGGLVGLLDSGASIITNKDITLDNPKITAKAAAGGVVGQATNISISGDGNIVINGQEWDKDTTKSFTSGYYITGLQAGGFIGYYIVNSDIADQQMPENVKINNSYVQVKGGTNSKGNAGGYFGYLVLQGNVQYTIGSKTKTNLISLDSFYNTNVLGHAYGAIAGKVTSTDISATLLIKNITINSYYGNGIYYHGGIVGELGTKGDKTYAGYMEISGITVTVYNPYAGASTSASGLGFGGMAGHVGNGSILKISDVTVSTAAAKGGTAGGSDTHIWEGGGLVGGASPESVIELSGTTDLTDVHYTGRNNTGQILGMQDCALVYARGDGNGNGWTFNRSKLHDQENYTNGNVSAWKVNDIGNYGEVIRLKAGKATTGLESNMISINDDIHEVTLSSLENKWSGTDVSIASTEEFALLSIAINSCGYFSADTTSVDKTNYTQLFGKHITLNADVDLTGTGILGLTRDNSNEDVYTGDLSGKDKTITLTLDAGMAYGFRSDKKVSQDDDGCGTLYAYGNNEHNSQGIFARYAGGKVSNLTIAGNIVLATNRTAGGGDKEVKAGGIAAELYVDSGPVEKEISGVTVSTKISAKITNQENSFSSFCIGGLFGSDKTTYAVNPTVTLTGDTQIKPELSIEQGTNVSADTKIYAGSAFGRLAAQGYLKFRCNSVTVGGSITSDEKEYAYVGGLVGVIKQSDLDNRWIEIRNLTYDNFTITANDVTNACGGLFGAIWSDVHVYFLDGNDSQTNLTVTDAKIVAPKAASVGGLAYRSSGLWQIQDYGIDIQKLSINAKTDVGLLVCRGENGKETVEGSEIANTGALYLCTTAYWDTAYKIDEITVSGNSGVFDEFVAHTSATSAEITENNKNGVVSLATKDRVGVKEDTGTCTTYVNRTANGEKHKTNGCSRYYYDLDDYFLTATQDTAHKGNGYIDTEEELLLWSVCRYVYSNIKKYMYIYDITDQEENYYDKPYVIGPENGTYTFNMEKYSYYPVDIWSGMTVRNCTFKFYNQNIENAETDNKSTKETGTGDTTSHSQHYTMHCGLFLNGHAAIKTDGTPFNTTVSVNNVTFQGSIGKLSDEGGSGALYAGTVSGEIEQNNVATATVILKNVTLDGLKITNYENESTSYAPLLMNKINSYSTVDISDVKTTEEYSSGTAVGSSLIGNVGTEKATQINLSFLDMVLPYKTVENGGIFSHATLLESFVYDTACVATYNFYKADDWTGSKYDQHKVTYGKEITGSVEYKDKQKWYYDEDGYEDTPGLVNPGTDFSKFLPYVWAGYDNDKLSHEIKVNQRVFDILHGCGTYGHPYEITLRQQLEIISEYLSTGSARTDWRITVSSSLTADTVICIDGNRQDITLQYDGNQTWKQVEQTTDDNGKTTWEFVDSGKEVDNTVMHRYMLNAYYDIQGKKDSTSDTATSTGSKSGSNNGYELTVTDFGGFGSDLYPFRGVITSTTGATLVLQGAGTSRGLIPYSYGSVVRDLKISYEGKGITLTKADAENAKSDYYPDICFGGVIGCVVGGDNIIDNVTVDIASNWLTFSGAKKYLIQAGGYVGSVCGGGVIFREMSGKTGLSDTMIDGTTVSVAEDAYKSLYVNPYVGRVLDGFAFYEADTEEKTIANTDKNYTINTLTAEAIGSIAQTENVGNSVDINKPQGMLLLSAIVNSGAASGGSSNAYSRDTTTSTGDDYLFGNTQYGKVRNATYVDVGKVTNAEDADFKLSVNDDRMVVSSENLPYLINSNFALIKVRMHLENSIITGKKIA